MAFGRKEDFAPLVCETPFNPNANSWWEIQEKVFTRWCNTHLNKRDKNMELGSMLRGGLDDGLLLWELLAEISNKEDELGRPNRRPKMRIHMVNNTHISLQFIEREKIKLVNIGAEDLVDRKLKLILGLIWTLILRYQIQKGNADAHGSAKNELLKWLNSIGINVKDLTYDWTDGKQICNLINKIREDLIPANKISDSPIENIQQAIDIAADEFDIPRVIDATDMASDTPDELVNMTYLSYFRDKWDELKAMASGELLGDNPRTVKAKKPVTFSISTHNITSPGQITVNILDKATGKPVPVASHTPMKWNSPKKDTWEATFTPLKEGNLSLDMFVNGKPVKNAPLVLFVTPPAYVKVAPGDRKATATKPAKIQLQTTNTLPSEIQVSAKDNKGRNIPTELVDTGNGTFDVKFTPLEQGKVIVEVKVDSENAHGAPVEIDVAPAPHAKLRPPQGRPTATKSTDLVLDVVNVRPDDLVAVVKDAQGNPRTLGRVKEVSPGVLSVPWVPLEKGPHTIEITLEGKPVEGCPLKVDVDPAPWARLNKPDSPPTASKPVKMMIEAINVKPSDLVPTVKDSTGKSVGAPKISDLGQGKFCLEFLPPQEGNHTVDVKLEGKSIEGAPMTFTVDPKPWARLNKPDKNPVAGKPFVLSLDSVNVKPSDLTIDLKDAAGRSLPKPQIKDLGNGKFEVEFTPEEKGGMQVDIMLEGKPIEGSPLKLNVEPKPWARLNRPSTPPVASKPFSLLLDVVNVQPKDLSVKILDAKGNLIPNPEMKDNKNGTFTLTFTPKDEGKLVVEVQLEGNHIENSPLLLTSDPKPWAKLREADRRPVAGKPFKLYLDSVNVKPSDLDAQILDSAGKVKKPTLKDLGNGTFELEFTPDQEGKVKIDVKLEGKPVEGSPMTLDVEPKPWARLNRPSSSPVADHPFSLLLDTINVSPSDLDIKVEDDKGKLLPTPTLKPLEGGKFEITFTPEHKGPHTISVNLEGKPVEGSPMTFTVAPCPWARVIGPSDREATATKPFSFGVETVNVKAEDLKVSVKDKDGKQIVSPTSIQVKDNNNDTYSIEFIFPHHGQAICEVLLEGKPIIGSPLNIQVAHKPTARVDHAPREGVAGKPSSFSLDTINVAPEDLEVIVTDPQGKRLPHKIKQNEDGKMTVGFTPLEPGRHKVDIRLEGESIPGAPFFIDVLPKPSASYNGPKPVKATAEKPCKIKIDTVNLKPEELQVDLRDREGRPVPVQVKALSPSQMEIEFTPKEKGHLLADLRVEGVPIEGAPIPIEVAPAPFARLVKPDKPIIAGRPFDLRLETINVTPDILDIGLVDDNGKKIPHRLRDNNDGTFDISFIPAEKGAMTANVNLEGKPVEGSPLSLMINPAPSARILNPTTPALANRPFKIDIESQHISPEDLTINILDKLGKRLPYRVRDTGMRNGEKNIFDVKFKPREEGPLKVEVLLEGSHIENSPLTLKVTPEPHARLLEGPRHCKVNETLPLKIEAINIKPEELEVHILDKEGVPVQAQHKLKDNGNGTFDLVFNPDQLGKYTIDVLYKDNQESIEGCPASIDVDPKTNWSDALKDLLQDMSAEAQFFTLVPISDLDHLETNKPVIFHIVPDPNKKLYATAVAFQGIVKSEGGVVVPALITSIDSGKFQMRFVPTTREKYSVDAQLSKKSIKNSPQNIFIGVLKPAEASSTNDKEMKIGLAIDRTAAVVGVPFTFQITYENSNAPLISAKVFDPSNKPLQFSTQAASSFNGKPSTPTDGAIDVTLTPEVKGTHSVRLYYEGAPTSGEAFKFEVTPAPYAEVVGPSHRADAVAQAPFTFQISTVNVRGNQITVGVKGPNGKVMASLNLDPTGKDTVKSRFAEAPGRPKNPNGVHDGVFDLTFTPKEIGRHTAMVFLDKKPITGSPIAIDVSENPTLVFAEGKTTETFSAPPTAVRAAEPVAKPAVQPQRAQPIVIQAVSVAAPAKTQPVVAVAPQQTQSSAVVVGDSKREGQIGVASEILIAVQNVKSSELATVAESDGKVLSAPVSEGNPGFVKCIVTPEQSGKLLVAITRAGAHIQGSPVTIEVAPLASPKRSKDKKKKDEKKSREKKEPTKVEIETKSRTVTRVTAGKSFTIRLQVGGSGGAPAEAPVKQKGKVIGQAKAKAGPDDTYEISWTPPHPGQYSTVLVIGGVEVGGSEFEFEAFNVPITCRPIANSENIGPGIPCTITFAIDNASPSALTAVIKGSDGKLGTDISTRRRADGTWDVNFTPPDSPSFNVELTADSTPVENKLTIQLV